MRQKIKQISLVLIVMSVLTACQNSPEPLEQPSGKLQAMQLTEETDTTDRTSDAKPDTLEQVHPADYEIVCMKDGDVEDSWIEKVNQELDRLPSNIKDAFLEDGWTIYVTDMDIDLTYYEGKYGGVMGSTNYREGRILIEDREEAVTQAPLHEIGHWLDFHHGYITDTDSFLDVFATDYGSFVNSYDINTIYDRKELFAEGFWQYLMNPQKLEMAASDLYWFLKDVIEKT